MTVVFQPIRPKKISEEIVEQIRAMISQGELKPGDRIPSERELAAMLGVSRPSVREAIMVLDAMGLVEARQGGEPMSGPWPKPPLPIPCRRWSMPIRGSCRPWSRSARDWKAGRPASPPNAPTKGT